MRPRTRPDLRVSSGVSLVETLVALGVLALGVLSVLQLFTVSGVVLERARLSTISVILAAQKIEELRAAGGVAGVSDGVDFVDAAGRVRTGRGLFAREWSTRPLPAAPDRLVLLRVRVLPSSGVDGPPELRSMAGEAAIVTILPVTGS